MSSPAPQKKSLVESLFGAPQIKLEKNRLEAFLDSVPAAYCGWDKDGGVAWNDTFTEALSLATISDFADIQNCFEPEDAAVLEGQFRNLRETGQSFTKIATKRGGEQFFRITGRRGTNLDADDIYDVLWLENITGDYLEKLRLKEKQETHSRELIATREACDSTPFPVWLRNYHLDISWSNFAYAALFDMTPAQIIAQQKELSPTVAELKNPVVRKEKLEIRAFAEEVKAERVPISREGHMVVDGKRRLFRFQEVPLPHDRGTIGFAFDITREEELQDELGRYQLGIHKLLEQLRSAIGIFNAHQELEFYNSAFAQLWKLDEPYLRSRPKLGDLMEKLREQRSLPEQANFRSFKQSWLDMFTQLLEPYEDMLYLPDGTALRMLAIAHPQEGLMMTFEDVTSRLELESSYNTLIAVQRETLDNLAEGVSVIGSDGRLRLWNPAFADMWGLHPEDLEGQPHITRLVEKMKPCFDSQFWPEYYDQLLALGLERKERKGRLQRADDLIIDYATLPLADGSVLLTYTDMTDTIQVEHALREKNTALETAERLKLDFLANVSYQLRTPLNSIMGFTELLDKELIGTLNDQQKEYTQNITEASERLLSLINDILDLSTIEAGYLELEKTSIDLPELLKNISELVHGWARQRKIDIHLDCPDCIGAVSADERRLKQVLLNLLRNAISFTPDDGSGIISIIAEKDQNRVLISVRDNGIGIPAEQQDRIFEPFERSAHLLDASPSKYRGAGLGLSIVKNIIELHGGSIRLESAPHEGTALMISLPLS